MASGARGTEAPLARTDHFPHAGGPNPAALPDIPGYQLLEVVGRGGMGTVYRAIHLAPQREVALKLVHAAGYSAVALAQRFEREVQTLTRIEHPNVVPVYDVGTWQGFPFYTMKYLPRGTLSRHVGRLRRDLPAACRIVASVARAVHHIHMDGIVHRDLKPDNILLDVGDVPLVADFGLALNSGDGPPLTCSGVAVGTRLFMAPEQTNGRKAEYGPATDVWALGVILYELLTGRHPFYDGDAAELYRRIREDAPPRARVLNPACPPGLEAVVLRCLAKRPRDRYPTAAALAADLDRWSAGQPVSAAAVPGARRPFGSSVLLAGLVVAVGGAFAVLTPPLADAPVAPPATAAERLARGEVVDLIGPTGGPLVAPLPVPGAVGLLSADRDGFCTLASLRFGATDLIREEVPLPVRFEAEVALSRGEGTGSWAAVYAGRKEHPGDKGPWHSQAQIAVTRTRAVHQVAWTKVTEVTDAVSAEAFWWQPAAGAVRNEVRRITASRREPATFPAPLEWHRVTLVLAPDRVTVAADGHEVAEVHGNELLHLGNGFRNRGWLQGAAAGPVFGPGIGLSVNNAEAVYRNARLVPVPEQHP